MSKDDYEWRLKYSPDQPRVAAGSPEGGRWTSGPSINWSRERGASGVVPVQMGEEHYYRAVQMKPEDFLALTPSILASADSTAYLAGRMESGDPIGPPWLAVTWNAGTESWEVTSHEGRHRAWAAIRLGAKKIPVDFVFNKGWRAKDVTDEMLRRPIQKQHLPGEYLEPVIEVGEGKL